MLKAPPSSSSQTLDTEKPIAELMTSETEEPLETLPVQQTADDDNELSFEEEWVCDPRSSIFYSNSYAMVICSICLYGGDSVVPRTRLQLGNRAYFVAGPVAWNSLPLDIRSAPTLSTFKSMFKTSFFTFLLHWLFRRVRAANIVRRPCSDSSHVTALINCRFIVIFDQWTPLVAQKLQSYKD